MTTKPEEHAKAVEHWAKCDQGLRGQELRAAAAELRRLAAVEAERDELLQLLSYERERLNGALDARIAERDQLRAQVQTARRDALGSMLVALQAGAVWPISEGDLNDTIRALLGPQSLST